MANVAMEDETGDELLQCLGEKIASGYSMVERLRLMDKIDGIDKLIRKIQQEIKFLEKARDTNYISIHTMKVAYFGASYGKDVPSFYCIFFESDAIVFWL